jgi:hypothetical protein
MQIKSNAIKFLHTLCFSLTTSTWTKAINQGFFKSIPILTATNIRRNLPKSMATTMGHLDQQRKNQQSTKKRPRPRDKEVTSFKPNEDISPLPNTKTNTMFATIVDLEEVPITRKSYSDLIGRFPAKSQQGNLYVLILYTYDDNAILAEPLKSRSNTNQLKAYQAILKHAGGGAPITMHWMDNEASVAIKGLLKMSLSWIFNSSPLTHISRTWQNGHSGLSRTTLSQDCAPPITSSPFGYWIGCSHRPKSPST